MGTCKLTLSAAALAMLLAGCASGGDQGFMPGENPDAAAKLTMENYLAPPPGQIGPDYDWKLEADEAAYRQGIKMRATPRGKIAAKDGDIPSWEGNAENLSRQVGFKISQDGTPNLYKLMKETVLGVDKSVGKVKHKYQRKRPYAVHPEDKTCRPDMLARHNPNYSYPSGHTAIAWAMALATASAVPEKADALLARAYEAGESRWICGYHWASDVQAGRDIGAAAFTQMMTDKKYQDLVKAARKEALAAMAAQKK